MEESAPSKALRDESAKNGKSVVFSNLSAKLPMPLRADQQVATSQGLSQTSSLSVHAKENVKLEDKLNYCHLVQLNELFKVEIYCLVGI